MSNFKREHTKAARAFLDDIIEVYRKHNLSLSHEDCHGAFQIEPYDQLNIDWLCEAYEVDPGQSPYPSPCPEPLPEPITLAARIAEAVRAKPVGKCFVCGANVEPELSVCSEHCF